MTVAPLMTQLASRALRWAPTRDVSHWMGVAASARVPAPVLSRTIAAYCRIYDVDLSEAEVPDHGFGSFDEFFTRKLKPGVRPVDRRAQALVSPADGRVESFSRMGTADVVHIKGVPYDLPLLLGDSLLPGTRDPLSQKFGTGVSSVIYLSPGDYHRVHAPVSGPITAIRWIDGDFFPVNKLGVKTIPGLFARNARLVVVQEHARVGTVATVMVGALGVGRMTLSFKHDRADVSRGQVAERRFHNGASPRLKKGEELGIFHMGSTVMVLASGPASAGVAPGHTIRVGQPLWEATLGR